MAGVKPWPCACAHGPTKNHEHPASVVAHQRACQQRRPSNKQQLRDLDTACTPGPAQPGNRPPYQWTLMICSLDQGKRPLRHDGDVDDLDMHNNGHVNNITKNGTCGISTVCTQTALNVPVSQHNGHVKLVKNCTCGISTGWSGHSLHCETVK